MELHKALYYDKRSDKTVVCGLCPHRCVIKDGGTGICRARKNLDGELYACGYGEITSIALDPIEKKPLNMFFPGSYILSVGGRGCNFTCKFCQNYLISQKSPQYKYISPQELVNLAIKTMSRGNIGIAYTYNEPLTSFEYLLDCSQLARKNGLKNVIVTNGFINEEPMRELLPFIDAMNIDLKAFNDNFYRNICGGSLEPVKNTISLCAKACHVEVTTLVIPGYNDSEAEIAAISSFIASISPEIPLHLTRHHPDYQMPSPAPIARQKLFELAQLAQKNLKYVFCGNC
jgi:pyruvate formate lyase activating enzyme